MIVDRDQVSCLIEKEGAEVRLYRTHDSFLTVQCGHHEDTKHLALENPQPASGRLF